MGFGRGRGLNVGAVGRARIALLGERSEDLETATVRFGMQLLQEMMEATLLVK